MTRDERIAARKAMIFPREKIGQKVTSSPARFGRRVNGIGRGGFPDVGFAGYEYVPWLILEDGFKYDPFDILGSAPEGGRTEGTIDITRRMRALVSLLRNLGFEDIVHPSIDLEDLIKDEDEEDCRPSSDYAIADNAYCPEGDALDSDYFDHDRYLYDFKEFVTGFFACDPTVVVTFHNVPHGSNEIEVTRAKPSVTAGEAPGA